MRGIGEEASAERLVDHARLDDRALEEIAREHDIAGFGLERLRVGPDHLAVGLGNRGEILRHRPPAHGHRLAMQLAGVEQLLHHRGNAAGTEEALGKEASGRLHIDQQRNLRAEALPVLERVIDAHVPRDRHHVDGAVRRGADRGRGDHGVLERLPGHNVGGAQILVHHRNDALARLVGHPSALAVRGGNHGAARERHAKRLGERIHRARGAHRVAVPDRGRRGRRPSR